MSIATDSLLLAQAPSGSLPAIPPYVLVERGLPYLFRLDLIAMLPRLGRGPIVVCVADVSNN